MLGGWARAMLTGAGEEGAPASSAHSGPSSSSGARLSLMNMDSDAAAEDAASRLSTGNKRQNVADTRCLCRMPPSSPQLRGVPEEFGQEVIVLLLWRCPDSVIPQKPLMRAWRPSTALLDAHCLPTHSCRGCGRRFCGRACCLRAPAKRRTDGSLSRFRSAAASGANEALADHARLVWHDARDGLPRAFGGLPASRFFQNESFWPLTI